MRNVNPSAGSGSSARRPPIPGYPDFEGVLENAGAVSLSGWAIDHNVPQSPIRVQVYEFVTRLADILADGDGHGGHGFTWAYPDSLRDGKTHSLRVCFGGTATDLTGSPSSVPIPVPPPVVVVPPVIVVPPVVVPPPVTHTEALAGAHAAFLRDRQTHVTPGTVVLLRSATTLYETEEIVSGITVRYEVAAFDAQGSLLRSVPQA